MSRRSVICNAGQAGLCYRAGDHGAALDFLQISRLLDPARAALWDQREAQARAAIPARVTVAEHGSSEYVSFHREPATGPAAGQLEQGVPASPAPAADQHAECRGSPAADSAVCGCCGTAQPGAGRRICQACGVVVRLQDPSAREYPDLSHGRPGHWCVLPGAVEAGREAEAGS